MQVALMAVINLLGCGKKTRDKTENYFFKMEKSGSGHLEVGLQMDQLFLITIQHMRTIKAVF
jgi:hypothetical protein